MYTAYPGDLFEANRRWHLRRHPARRARLHAGSAYCADYNCAVEKLKELTVAAGDQPSFGTQWALDYIVNLMGDIHEPVNVIDAGDDHGSTTIVRSTSAVMKLSDLWDRNARRCDPRPDVASRRRQAYLKEIHRKRQARLVRRHARRLDDARPSASRATSLIAEPRPQQLRKAPYACLPLRGRGEVIVREQIKKAGVRLACWLDANLK